MFLSGLTDSKGLKTELYKYFEVFPLSTLKNFIRKVDNLKRITMDHTLFYYIYNRN